MAGDAPPPFSFWRFSDDLRSHSNTSDDVQWNLAASKLALVDRMRNLKFNPHQNPNLNLNLNLNPNHNPNPKPNPGPNPPHGRLNDKVSRGSSKSSKQKLPHPPRSPTAAPGNGMISSQNPNLNSNPNHNPNPFGKAAGGKSQKESAGRNTENNNSGQQQTPSDKRFKSLPPAETLPRNETLGGYVFVCNNDTMEEDLKRHLFGLPQRYRDSVRAIRPGLPLFLYNYTTHQLHGIFEATTFGGSNIDPTAWEDKKCKGESRFPAQVRTRLRKLCKPLEEDSFRPVLHHYDGPKFRLELSMPETVALLDLFTGGGLS